MIRINLIRERRAPGGARKVSAAPSEGVNPMAVVGLVVIVAACLGFTVFKYISLSRDITQRENERAELEREKQRLEPIIRQKEELEAKRAELERKINVIKELRKKQQAPVRLLDELSRSLPDYVWFESLTEQGFQVSIDGRALNPNKMADYVDNLNHSGYFQEIDLHNYGADQDDTTKFRLSAVFHLPEPAGDEAAEGGESP